MPAAPALPKLEFDDAWTNGLTGKYRAVFDSPEVDEGTALFNAYAYRKEFKDVYKLGDADVNAVIVVRHRAIPMILDDTMWGRYKLGETTRIKDPATGKWAVRNPFWKADPSNKEYGDLALETMLAQGVVVLGCALATEGMAGMIASRTGDKPDAMFDELRRHLLPSVMLQPSGIFAVMRAQVAGCHYMRST